MLRLKRISFCFQFPKTNQKNPKPQKYGNTIIVFTLHRRNTPGVSSLYVSIFDPVNELKFSLFIQIHPLHLHDVQTENLDGEEPLESTESTGGRGDRAAMGDCTQDLSAGVPLLPGLTLPMAGTQSPALGGEIFKTHRFFPEGVV